MAAADGSPGAADGATVPGSWSLLQAPCGRAQAFECMVGYCQIRQFDESPGSSRNGVAVNCTTSLPAKASRISDQLRAATWRASSTNRCEHSRSNVARASGALA